MEKGYLHWKADLLTEFDPFETRLDRFVRMEKPDFVGKAALAERQANGPSKRLVTLVLDSRTAPAHGGASVMLAGRVVGTVTSGGWGHRTGCALGLALLREPDLPDGLSVAILGRRYQATRLSDPPFDPDNLRLKG